MARALPEISSTFKFTTGHFRPIESFFTQVDHIFSTNCFSKQVMDCADFFNLKIWTQSDHWLANFLAITFEPVVRLSPYFEREILCTIHGLFAKSVYRKQ